MLQLLQSVSTLRPLIGKRLVPYSNMKPSQLRTLLLASGLALGLAATSLGQSQSSANAPYPEHENAELNNLLNQVRARIQQYHQALFNIAVTENVSQQELRADATPKGKSRAMVYESIILHHRSSASQQEGAPVITRTLKFVNGKPAKESEPASRSKCVNTNPPPAYGDPLSFLLADGPVKLIYAYAGETELEGVRTAVVTATPPPVADPIQIIMKDNCFRLSRGLQTAATIWIDPKTFDVLQVKWQLAESFTGKIPAGVAKVGFLPLFRPRRQLTYEKSDFMIRFRRVTFQNPEQTLLLPASSESVSIMKGAGIAGFQTITEYSRYRRFKSSLEIKDSDGNED